MRNNHLLLRKKKSFPGGTGPSKYVLLQPQAKQFHGVFFSLQIFIKIKKTIQGHVVIATIGHALT
jgi:hypothetical protein